MAVGIKYSLGMRRYTMYCHLQAFICFKFDWDCPSHTQSGCGCNKIEETTILKLKGSQTFVRTKLYLFWKINA